ncbi:membrane protein FAM174A-like [Thrips palmi]|uniref:Membrane protein FAM174A-like n=1 Tax=Thrips palmi TaxID=161013 RepID=A0A6P8ZCV5_THRPL|nr:membrane protein FAM174A-like [Thrips palmi]
MSPTTATKSVIMSPKVLSLFITVSVVFKSDGSLSAPSPGRGPDTSQSQVLVHSDATVPKVGDKPGNASQPDCGSKPCEVGAKAPSNASASLPNEAEGIVHISDDSDDLSKKLNPEALMRGFYVFVGLSIIVMAYIAWKSFGKRPTQIHRYGVVGNRDDLEMAPLDSDDGDDDDTTHFDISNHRLQT